MKKLSFLLCIICFILSCQETNSPSVTENEVQGGLLFADPGKEVLNNFSIFKSLPHPVG